MQSKLSKEIKIEKKKKKKKRIRDGVRGAKYQGVSNKWDGKRNGRRFGKKIIRRI